MSEHEETPNVLTRADDLTLPADLPGFIAWRALVVSTGDTPKRQIVLQEIDEAGAVTLDVGGLAETEAEALAIALKNARDAVNARSVPDV